MPASYTKASFSREITALVDRVWASAFEAGREQMRAEILRSVSGPPQSVDLFTRPEPPSPQKLGAQGRAEHGSIKNAVHRTVYDHPDGITRSEMFRYARESLGVVIKDGSMKQAIRILRIAGDIYNKDGKWFPSPGS